MEFNGAKSSEDMPNEPDDGLTKDVRKVKSYITYLRDTGFRLNDRKVTGETMVSMDEFADHIDNAITFLLTVGEENDNNIQK